MKRESASALHAIILIASLAVSPRASADPAVLDPLIASLASEEFKVRENASKELLRLAREDPAPVEKAILHQLLTTEDPEVLARSKKLILDLLAEDIGFIGIRHIGARILDEERNEVIMAAKITDIIPGLPAEAAGLRVLDDVLSVDGNKLSNLDTAADLSARIGAAGSGKPIELEILRNGERMKINVTTMQKPPELQTLDPEAEFQKWLRKNAAPKADE